MPTKENKPQDGLYEANEIARYFIRIASEQEVGEDNGKKEYEGITHLKLQKLLYFAQVYFLVNKGVAAFKEDMEAWKHGSVVREVYDKYKRTEGFLEDKEGEINIADEDKELLDSVWEFYGKYSAWKLVDIIHNQKPWIDAFKNGQGVIEKKVLQEYYKDLVE